MSTLSAMQTHFNLHLLLRAVRMRMTTRDLLIASMMEDLVLFLFYGFYLLATAAVMIYRAQKNRA